MIFEKYGMLPLTPAHRWPVASIWSCPCGTDVVIQLLLWKPLIRCSLFISNLKHKMVQVMKSKLHNILWHAGYGPVYVKLFADPTWVFYTFTVSLGLYCKFFLTRTIGRQNLPEVVTCPICTKCTLFHWFIWHDLFSTNMTVKIQSKLSSHGMRFYVCVRW